MNKLGNPIPSLMAAVLFLILGAIACGGCDVVIDEKLASDYEVIAIDTLNQTMISKRVSTDGLMGIVDPMVFAYGWNDDFIVAKQHPLEDTFVVNTNITNWFIVEVASGKVHGPLTEKEYLALRKELDVPDLVTFTETIVLEN